MFPLFVRLDGRLGVVVGGGPVGRRKARALLSAGARVRIVCLEPPSGVWDNSRLHWLTEPYRPSHLDGAALAFAAGPPEVNRAVVADAKARGVWVNAADDPSAGDFFVPATVRRGPFTLAVGTGGAAPALARRVRERLEATFDGAFGQWVELLAEFRSRLLAGVSDPAVRRSALEGASDWAWLERVRREGVEAVRHALDAEARRLGGDARDPRSFFRSGPDAIP